MPPTVKLKFQGNFGIAADVSPPHHHSNRNRSLRWLVGGYYQRAGSARADTSHGARGPGVMSGSVLTQARELKPELREAY